ncbi:sulfite exporter TauE/SafE family protein [Acuticoccus sp. M5D2P5]|uniref:sulfite exporter TauE/SafE family protein n=1 Tax=Acuticoccus kalidii TaxID=2910977 RepID=UPI001F21754B|nr:sulfite exporter TauE/SafE family protein [Acuticoccus kalidii]MCF3932704.1 sulfite exporter TauE/SafE family protein [Acuticoccus kalidii]
MEFVAAGAIVFVAAFVRGATGFGFALVTVPLLTLFWSPLFATSVAILLDLVASGVLLRSGLLADLRRRDTILVAIGALAGAPVGVFAIAHLPAEPAAIALNIAVLLSALAALTRIRWEGIDRPAVVVAVGAATGLLVGAFAIGGTLLVAWLVAARRTPNEIRVLLAVIFAAVGVLALAMRVSLGAFPSGALTQALFLAPITALGILAGHHAVRFIHPEMWKRGVAVVLIMLALLGLVAAIT